MKIVYWCDLNDDVENEAKFIKKQLADIGISRFNFLVHTNGPQILKDSFDILFFDWGGMSMGNSLLEHFCDYILKHAEENPSRIYIMNSTFTAYAMRDAKEEYGDEFKEIPNVFLNFVQATPYIKEKEREE